MFGEDRYDYDEIAPILADARQEGTTMHCLFRCPRSGLEVRSSAPLRHEQGLGQKVSDSAKRSMMHGVSRSISRAIYGVLGRGVVGRTAADAAQSLIGEGQRADQQRYSEEERQAAIVDAFTRVADRFVRDDEQGWVARQAAQESMGDFERILEQGPVHTSYDRSVLARMLVETVAADGRFEETERAFVAEFLPPEMGGVQEIYKRPALSEVELSETSPGTVRETMLMLAWAVALCDQDLATAEQDRLYFFARGLGIRQDRLDALRRAAMAHALESSLKQVYRRGHPEQEERRELLALGEQLGLEPHEIERIEIGFRKRHGIF